MRRSLPFLRSALPLAGLLLGSVAAAQDRPVRSLEFGQLSPQGYEAREVILDPPHREILADGSVRLHEWGIQITVRAGAFPTRALDPILLLGGTPIHRFEQGPDCDRPERIYTLYDPALVRAEKTIEIIYGDDERTRTRWPEVFDPERIERLPPRLREGRPQLEFLHFTRIEANGAVTGASRLAGGARVLLAAERRDGGWVVAAQPLERYADGKFSSVLPAASEAVTHAVALRVPAGVALPRGTLRELPQQVEILDRKPLVR